MKHPNVIYLLFYIKSIIDFFLFTAVSNHAFTMDRPDDLHGFACGK